MPPYDYKECPEKYPGKCQDEPVKNCGNDDRCVATEIALLNLASVIKMQCDALNKMNERLVEIIHDLNSERRSERGRI